MITQEELKNVLRYDADSGDFFWTKNRSRMAKSGQRAGGIHYTQGYVRIHLRGKMYQASSLAYLYMTGNWPVGEIDHINGTRDDNRWGNLRLVSRQLNGLNRKRYETNTSGSKGVSWHAKLKKWRVRIQMFGERKALGCFDTIEEASSAYERAAQELYGHHRRIEQDKRERA